MRGLPGRDHRVVTKLLTFLANKRLHRLLNNRKFRLPGRNKFKRFAARGEHLARKLTNIGKATADITGKPSLKRQATDQIEPQHF